MKRKSEWIPFLAHFEPEQFEQLVKISKRERIPINNLIRDAVMEHLGWICDISEDSEHGKETLLGGLE